MATAKTKKSKSRKSKKPGYQPIIELPRLSYEEFTALRDSIAVNGVLVPILVDEKKNIIDGNYRKQIAIELGYDCPELVQEGLDEDEKRTLARCLNLARRQLNQEQKRELIADQLLETPERSNRWIAKQLGVHHATVGHARNDLESSGHIIRVDRTVGEDGRVRKTARGVRVVPRTKIEQATRLESATLIRGDCRKELKKIASNSIDAIISDPPYPCINRDYGRLNEKEWHALMHEVVTECRRVLKPKGSAVFILQPNYERVGKMRLWLWEFMVWAGKEWNLVQDAYWWAIDKAPTAGCKRTQGLMRQSVKACVWLGEPNCYRNQDNVLWTSSEANSARRRSDIALRTGVSGNTYRNSSFSRATEERGGTTPFNLLPVSLGGKGQSWGHPAPTPLDVAAWWCRYLVPPGGTLLDCFAGSGTVLSAGLNEGAGHVIGIEKSAKYLKTAKKRIMVGE